MHQLTEAVDQQANTWIQLRIQKELIQEHLNGLKRRVEIRKAFNNQLKKNVEALGEHINIEAEQAAKKNNERKKALIKKRKDKYDKCILECIEEHYKGSPFAAEFKQKTNQLDELEKQLDEIRDEKTFFETNMKGKKRIKEIMFQETVKEMAQHMVRYNKLCMKLNDDKLMETSPMLNENQNIQMNEVDIAFPNNMKKSKAISVQRQASIEMELVDGELKMPPIEQKEKQNLLLSSSKAKRVNLLLEAKSDVPMTDENSSPQKLQPVKKNITANSVEVKLKTVTFDENPPTVTFLDGDLSSSSSFDRNCSHSMEGVPFNSKPTNAAYDDYSNMEDFFNN